MSIDQLMPKAYELQAKAIAKSMDHHGVRPAPKPGDPPFAPEPGEDETRAAIIASFSDIPSLFEPFTIMPTPSSFDGPIEDIDEAMKVLSLGYIANDPISGEIYRANPDLAKVGGSRSYLDTWTGAAREAFEEDFLTPFPAMVTNQFIECAVLRGALAAEQALWSAAQDNILKVVQSGINALENMDHCGQNKWTMVWTIVASVAAVAAVPISGGTSLAALAAVGTVTAVGSAAQVAAAHQVQAPYPTDYHGESAEAVIGEVRAGVAHVISEIQRAEEIVVGALNSNNEFISGQPSYFVAPQPKLANATPANVFHEDYLGHGR